MSRFFASGARAGVSAFVVMTILAGCEPPPPDVGAATDETDGRYIVFERRPRFEPSAVTRIGATDRFLVASDKSDMPAVTVFTLDLAPERPPRLLEGKSFSLDAMKLEAVAPSRRNPGVFYAVTSFDRPGAATNRLIRFALDEKGRLVSQEALDIFHPAQAAKRLLGQPWAKVEGLGLSPDENQLLVGVRAVGPDHRHTVQRFLGDHDPYVRSSWRRPVTRLGGAGARGQHCCADRRSHSQKYQSNC